eukprot:scaffold12969_cov65-Attheya_sp.AAC.1
MVEEWMLIAAETTAASEDTVSLLLAVTRVDIAATVENNMQAHSVVAVSEKWKCTKCGHFVDGWKKQCTAPYNAWKGGKQISRGASLERGTNRHMRALQWSSPQTQQSLSLSVCHMLPYPWVPSIPSRLCLQTPNCLVPPAESMAAPPPQ